MNQQNKDSGESSPADLPMKRKRGRPSKDESVAQQEYFLSVKVEGTEKQMRGVVFIARRVTPVSAKNDVAPHVKMHKRAEIVIPSLNEEQTQPQEQLDIDEKTDTSSEPPTGGLAAQKNQSVSDHPANETGCGSECPAQPLMLQPKNADPSVQGGIVQAIEVSAANDRANNADSTVPKDSVAEATTLMFISSAPLRHLNRRPLVCSSNPNLDILKNETKTAESEQQHKPHQYTEHRGFNVMTETGTSLTAGVPAELQLELDNKTTNGNGHTVINSITETNHPQSSASRSGFLANLFEGKANSAEQETAAAETSFTVTNQTGNSSVSTAANTNKNVDCNIEEAVPPVQLHNPVMLN